ncbi:MAG: SOS response-associated peptidase [Ignavibacteria bacterium]|nr:SOS response-associated peptidase [Ignavibacteria bacterium]
MCSWFQNKETGKTIFKKLEKDFKGSFKLESDEELKKINIRPTDKIYVIVNEQDNIIIKSMRWGIRFDEEKKSPLIFNIRSETVKDRKFWSNLFKNNPCLIPMTSFFEWKSVEIRRGEKAEKKKIPCKISFPQEKLFFAAGLFTKLNNGQEQSTLLTTEPNTQIKEIHNRMPVILEYQTALDIFKDEFEKNLEKLKPCKMPFEIEINPDESGKNKLFV